MGELDVLCPIITYKTTGDRIQDRPLAELGGKGLFVKEIEDALLQDIADIAVHSAKDLPGQLPHGLYLGAVLEREDPRDMLITATANPAAPFDALPKGARLGTSSVHRTAQALRLRPDLQIVPLRGNVETRLGKLARGEADGILLARAGLERLHIHPKGATPLSTDLWLPALAQGAIGIELRAGDEKSAAILAKINHGETAVAIACERAFLMALNGSCRTPIGGLATVKNNQLQFRGEVLSEDGRNAWSASRAIVVDGHVSAAILQKAADAGREAAEEILARAQDQMPRG